MTRPTRTSAAWFDDSWAYRKSISISTHNSVENNVYINLTGANDLDTSDTTRFQSDCGDLRFTTQAGNLLNYYIVSGCGTADTVVHVFFDSFPAGPQTIYYYYGNPSVPNGYSSADFATLATNYTLGNQGAEEKAPSPAAYWRFDEGNGSTSFDATSNKNTVTLNASWTQDQCPSGKCLNFNNTNVNANYAAASDSASLDQTGDMTVSTWFEADTQKTTNSDYKVLVVFQGSSGYNLKDQYTSAGYNVVLDGNLNSVADVATHSADIILCDAYAWGCSSKATLLNSLYDAGYNVVTKGNDNRNNIYPIATSHNATFTSQTVAPNEKHPLTNGWSTSGNSGGDGGYFIDTIHSSAISVARDNETHVAIYLEEPGKGRWFHYQHLNTIDSTLFSNINEFMLRYNLVSKGKNYNFYTYNGNLYGYVNNQKLFGTTTYNTWNHASLVYDKTGGNIYLYQNGNQLATASYSTTLDIDNQKLIIGSLMKGQMDELKISPFARSALQVKADINSRGSVEGVSTQIGSNKTLEAALSNGLVGYWKMDEATWSGTPSEVIDSSGNANHGQAMGTTGGRAYPQEGKYANGGFFDGVDDYYQVAMDYDIMRTTDTDRAFTFAAWVKPNATPVGDENMILGRSGCHGGLTAEDEGQFAFSVAATDCWSNGRRLTSGTIANFTNWHHVVGVYEARSMRIYVDGTLKNSTTFPSAASIYDYSTWLFAGAAGSAYSFDGKIDEARIYNRALSLSEISALYNWTPGPQVYLTFDEASGNPLDESGNNHTMSLTGSPNRVSGKYGKALNSNGSGDYGQINLSSDITFGVNNSFSVSTWFKSPTASTSYNNTGIIGNYNTITTPYWNLHFHDASSVDAGKVSFNLRDTNSAEVRSVSTSRVDNNSWHHLAAVRDVLSDKVYLYVDGVLVDSDTDTTTTTINSGQHIWLGNHLSRYYPFQMDEVKIYNYARNSKQIVEDMNGSHPAGGSPVGSQMTYLRFDEGAGGVAYDSGFAKLNANINGSATWTNEGRIRRAILFDGSNDYVNWGDVSNYDFNTPNYSISAWVKIPDTPNNAGGCTARYPIFYNHDWGYNLSVNSSRGLTFWRYYDASNRYLMDSNTILSPNTWYLITAVQETDKMIIYINGIKDKELATPNTAIYYNAGASYEPQIGRGVCGGTTFWYKGLMDEFKIYDFSLNQEEITREYNQGQALVLGSTSTDSDGKSASNSAARTYCVPGDTSTCNPPVAEWNFNEKQGGYANDRSGNNNLGTLNNSPSWKTSAQCKVGSCLYFNGNDVSSSTGPNPTSAGTVEAWVKVNAWGTNYDSIVFKGPGIAWADIDYAVIRDNTNQRFIATIGNGTNTLNGSGPVTPTINLGQWYHIVFTWNSTQAIIYTNGVPSTPVNWAYGAGNRSSNLRIGRAVNGSSYPFNGYVDEVKIYNYARTPAQIAYSYNQGGPVGWWRLDECQGGTAYDSTDNKNNGTITIGSTIPQNTPGTCTTPTDGSGAWYNGKNGKYGASLKLDGADDYIQMSDPQISSNFSIALWVKPTGNIVNLSDALFDTKPSAVGALRVFGSAGTGLRYDIGGDATGASIQIGDWSGQWHHVTLVLTNSNVTKIYIDGKLEGSHTNTVSASSNTIQIGRFNSGNYLSGQVDDIRAYNYSLTETQINQLYNEGAGVRFGPATGNP